MKNFEQIYSEYYDAVFHYTLSLCRDEQMAGGQQQRVALARALASGAEIILADEPTGALDKKTGIELMEILKSLNGNGKTVIIVTHDPAVADYAKNIITTRTVLRLERKPLKSLSQGRCRRESLT